MKHAYLWWLLLLAAVTTAQAQTPQAISVYVVAHPDDWQLFMSPNAYGDLTDTQGKIVFIYLTSGDGTHGMGYDPSQPYGTVPYFKARELAAVASARFVTNQTPGPITPATESVVNVPSGYHTGGRNITTYKYRNVVHYFLRLPDSVEAVGGYPHAYYTHTVIDRLIDRPRPTTTIDNSATYANFTDISDQVARIMIRESETDWSNWVSYPYKYLNHSKDYQVTMDYPDHGDHVNAGRIAHEAAISLDWDEYAFEGYNTADKLANLAYYDIEGMKNEVGLYATVSQTLMEYGYNSNWDHKNWLGSNYFDHVTSHSRAALSAPATAPDNATTKQTTALEDIEVYPVPSNRDVRVRVPRGESGAAELTLYDYRMRKLKELQSPTGDFAVDLRPVPAGVYFVQVKTAKKLYRRRLVKTPE